MSDRIEARAFRGTRKKSVYRDHALAADDLALIVEVGQRSGFALVASLASLPLELDKEDARRLAGELSELRLGAELLDLDDDSNRSGRARAVLRAHARRRVADRADLGLMQGGAARSRQAVRSGHRPARNREDDARGTACDCARSHADRKGSDQRSSDGGTGDSAVKSKRAVGLVQQPCRRCWLSRRPVAARCWRARSIPRPLTRSVPFPAASWRFGARVRGTLLSIVIAAEPSAPRRPPRLTSHR